MGTRRLGIFVTLALTLTFVLAPSSSAAAAPGGDVRTYALTSDHKTKPLGIDDRTPSFGWKIRSNERSQAQSAYRVLVASSRSALAHDDGDMWDSGKVESSESLQVTYEGDPLVSRHRYYWKVMVWDASGDAAGWSAPTWFETGLLDADDWSA
ncbi:MAG: hypothetical protein L0K86_16640, partial [Actinomycetia bacterium]|nr:hypothetical protein [Actinomycetes bacterium]